MKVPQEALAPWPPTVMAKAVQPSWLKEQEVVVQDLMAVMVLMIGPFRIHQSLSDIPKNRNRNSRRQASQGSPTVCGRVLRYAVHQNIAAMTYLVKEGSRDVQDNQSNAAILQ